MDAIAVVRGIGSSTEHGQALTYQRYTTLMAKSAALGGLWADTTIIVWTARALNVTIHTYRCESTSPSGLDHKVWGLPSPNSQHLHMLFTGPLHGGHYTPFLPHTPIVEAEANRTPNNFKSPPAPNHVIQALEAPIDLHSIPPPSLDTLNHIACTIANEEMPNLDTPTLANMIRFVFPQPLPEPTLFGVAQTMHTHVRLTRAMQANPLTLLRKGIIMGGNPIVEAVMPEAGGVIPMEPRNSPNVANPHG